MSSCDNSNIRQNYIVTNTNEFDTFTACTGIWTSNIYGCSPITIQDQLNLNGDVLPNSDSTINLGSTLNRFRNINTVSGTSSIWTSTVKVITPSVDLGLDSNNESRVINANNSILQDDILMGGTF
jgi:hypothetical protein